MMLRLVLVVVVCSAALAKAVVPARRLDAGPACHQFLECKTGGWQCEGSQPAEVTLDCSKEEGVTVCAWSNLPDSVETLTVQGCPLVNMSFLGFNTEKLSKLKTVKIQNVATMMFLQTTRRARDTPHLPENLYLADIENATFAIESNNYTKSLNFKNVKFHALKGSFSNVTSAVWDNVTMPENKPYSASTFSIRSDDLVFDIKNSEVRQIQVVGKKMSVVDSVVDLENWGFSVQANDSFTFRGNEVKKLRSFSVKSERVVVANNRFLVIFSHAFASMGPIKVPSYFEFTGNEIDHLQAGALDLPADDDYGNNFITTYEANLFNCSCKNVNFFKDVSYEGSNHKTGRQVVENEKLLRDKDTFCSNDDCEAQNAVYRYRELCAITSNFCTKFYYSTPASAAGMGPMFVQDKEKVDDDESESSEVQKSSTAATTTTTTSTTEAAESEEAEDAS